MSNVYKTFDYSQIPITQLRDKDRENLSKIANFTIRNLCKNNNSNLLIFPQQLDIHHDGIADSYIFTMDNQKLQTGDLLGFVGIMIVKLLLVLDLRRMILRIIFTLHVAEGISYKFARPSTFNIKR